MHSIFHEILITDICHQRSVTVPQFFILFGFHLGSLLWYLGKLWSDGPFSTAVESIIHALLRIYRHIIVQSPAAHHGFIISFQKLFSDSVQVCGGFCCWILIFLFNNRNPIEIIPRELLFVGFVFQRNSWSGFGCHILWWIIIFGHEKSLSLHLFVIDSIARTFIWAHLWTWRSRFVIVTRHLCISSSIPHSSFGLAVGHYGSLRRKPVRRMICSPLFNAGLTNW